MNKPAIFNAFKVPGWIGCAECGYCMLYEGDQRDAKKLKDGGGTLVCKTDKCANYGILYRCPVEFVELERVT